MGARRRYALSLTSMPAVRISGLPRRVNPAAPLRRLLIAGLPSARYRKGAEYSNTPALTLAGGPGWLNRGRSQDKPDGCTREWDQNAPVSYRNGAGWDRNRAAGDRKGRPVSVRHSRSSVRSCQVLVRSHGFSSPGTGLEGLPRASVLRPACLLVSPEKWWTTAIVSEQADMQTRQLHRPP